MPSTARRSWPLRGLVVAWGALLAAALLLVFLFNAAREADVDAWRHARAVAVAEAARITVVAERLVVAEPAVITEVLVHGVLQGELDLAVVTDPQFHVVASTQAAGLRQPLERVYPELHRLLREHGVGEQLQLLEDRDAGVLSVLRSFEWPSAEGELRSRARGALWLRLDVARAVQAERERSLRTHLGDSVVLVLFALPLLLGLDRLVLRPMARLRLAAESLGEGRLHVSLPHSRVHEIEELGQALERSGRDLRQTLQRLVESEQRFRALTASAPDAIITLDDQGRVDQFNQAAERLFGYAADEIRGQTLAPLLPAGQHEAHARHVQAFGGEPEGTSRRMEAGRLVRGRHRDGHLLHLEVGISRSRIGEQFQYTAVVRDVSDRVAVEAELESHRRGLEELVRRRTQELVHQSDRAQAATRAKSEFLARIGHELRTPMNTVLGMAHLLRQHVDGEAAPRLQALETAARQLHTLMADILDFTRLEAGQLALTPTETDLRTTVAAAVAALPPSRHDPAVELVLWIDADVPTHVLVDGLRLRQVLVHLLDNALKFTSAGHVTLRVARSAPPMVPGPQEPDGPLRFEVSDTGIGIAPDDLSRLFQPFEQLDRGDARAYGGAGIGLVICQRVLALMDSELDAQSQPGRGSRFGFTLRCPGVPPPVAPAQAVLAGRALVVDTLPEARAAQAEALRSLGLVTDTADSVVSALRALRAAQQRGAGVDWVLVGGAAPGPLLRLPDDAAAQGLALQARWVLAMPRHQAPPLADVLRAGYLGALEKPVMANLLAERLADWTRVEGAAAVAEAPRPAPVPPADALPHLAGVPGLDVQRGLQSLRGNEAAYRRLLGSFVTFHTLDPQRLRQAADAGDRAAWRARAHSLKATAGAVGAQRVFALAQAAAGAATADGGDLSAEREAVFELAGELRRLLDDLARRDIGPAPAAPGVPSVPPATGATPLEVATLRASLRESLARRDMAALRSLQTLSDAELATLGVLPAALREAVLAFDYDAALRLLAQGERERP